MKNWFKILGIIALLVVMGTFSFSCASINTNYMDSNILAKDHAYLHMVGVTGFSIDDKARQYGDFDGFGVLIPPGEHTIYLSGYIPLSMIRSFMVVPVFEYIKNTIPVIWTKESDYNGNPIETTERTSSQFVFEPGHFYVLYNPHLPGDADVEKYRSSFIIVDETDPQLTWANYPNFIWSAEERVSKARKQLDSMR